MESTARKLKVADHTAANPAGKEHASLVSPAFDVLFIGGASVLLLFLMHLTLRADAPDSQIAWFVFNLSFVANFPHFMVSYQMLYKDFGSRIRNERRYFWAAIVVPALLFSIFAAGYLSGSPVVWGYLANSMFFFVGWHYVKQTFGGIVVTNSLRGFFYNKLERAALKTNLFSLWAISFLVPNTKAQGFVQDGIPYSSMDLPPWLLTAAYGLLIVSGAAVVWTNLMKYVREGKAPALAAIACFSAIYAWYLPAMSHPMFMHTIPFFHSAQYLMFVYVFRRNKVNAQIKNLNETEKRKRWLLGTFGYFTVPVLAGICFMYVLPRFLDSLQGSPGAFGPTPAFFAFTLFINVHHYFIDNVLWRGDNQEMRTYLFSRT